MTLDALTDRRGVVVSTLGITQTLAWGSTYYLPAVFADPIATALDVPRVWFFGIFSAALLLSGLLGPLAGRMIDRHGGRDVLAATNLLFAAGLAAMAFASGPVGLALAWTILGIGMGFGLYEAAFATVAGSLGRQARTDHRHHPVRRLRQHGGLARQRDLHRRFRLARRLPGLGRAAPADRIAAEPPAGPPVVTHAQGAAHPHEAASGVPWTMIVLASVFGATWFVSTAMAAHLPRLLQAMGSTQALLSRRPRWSAPPRSAPAWSSSACCAGCRR